MRLTKVIGIILIITLGMGVFGGCRSINKEAAKEQAAEVIQISEDDKGDGGSKMPKKAERIEDLYYYKENYSPFAQEGDEKALIEAGEEEKTFKIGQDLNPGEYMAVSILNSNGSLKITKDGNGEADDYIVWEVFDVNAIFKVKAGEFITLRGCNVYPIEGVFKHPMDDDAYLPGMFKVGMHLPEGEYLAVGKHPSIEVYGSQGLEIGDRIFSVYEGETDIFTVKSGQHVRAENCKLFPIEKAPAFLKERPVFSKGIHKVGVTIPAGTYTARTTEDLGRVTLYKDSLFNDKSALSYTNVDPEADVVLTEGQYVKIEYAELRLAFGTSSASSVVEKGADIVFDAGAKPVLSAKAEAVYKIGKDIERGEYMLLAKESGAYVEVNDGSGEIITNAGFDNCMLIDLEQGERLKIQYCEVYPIDHVPYVPKKDTGYLPGRYKVGIHIPAGEYMAVGKHFSLYTYGDKSWEWESQEAMLIMDNYGIITLQEGKYFDFNGQGALYPIDIAPPVVIKEDIYKTGMFKVGMHMLQGIYECSAVGADGYVVICKDSKNEGKSEISTTRIKEKEQITVTEGQYVAIYGAALKLKEKKAKALGV